MANEFKTENTPQKEYSSPLNNLDVFKSIAQQPMTNQDIAETINDQYDISSDHVDNENNIEI